MIDGERWQQVKALVDEALDRPVDDRPAFVAEACGDDVRCRGQRETEPTDRVLRVARLVAQTKAQHRATFEAEPLHRSKDRGAVVHSLVDLDVVPHEEDTPKYYAVVPPETPSEQEQQSRSGIIPYTQKPTPIRPTNIGGATDPDVDPAMPQ